MPIVIKGDGEREEFQIDKLVRSLTHSGADTALSGRIAGEIARGVTDGMTTTEIYQKAFRMLHKEESVVAARYSMRRAILDLGPTGFPFEDFIGELFRARGYTTSTRVVVKGRCAEHEVDVVMRKGNRTIGAELKFHNTPGFKTDIKTALYVRARYWDIEWGAEDRHEKAGIDEGWLITNTKFTTNAMDYAECAGIALLGWNYPKSAGLSEMIKQTGIYPITVLTTLSKTDKARLLAAGVTLCHTIMQRPDSLAVLGLPPAKVRSVVAESTGVCKV
ncbi:restriction endonuclease [Candidatus Kaiserbacteria bacterium]|nr:restriction endonuclease [Candidatus Kaiserbacteria bacterium]